MSLFLAGEASEIVDQIWHQYFNGPPPPSYVQHLDGQHISQLEQQQYSEGYFYVVNPQEKILVCTIVNSATPWYTVYHGRVDYIGTN